jgi:hypothetical protein
MTHTVSHSFSKLKRKTWYQLNRVEPYRSQAHNGIVMFRLSFVKFRDLFKNY